MVGGNVRRRRKHLNLSQTEVARQARMSRSYLCEIERGKACPSLAKLAGLASALRTTSGALLDGPIPPPDTP